MLDAPLLLLTLLLTAPPGAGSFEATRARALKAFKASDYKSACELYERAARLNPTHAMVHSDLGLCLARLGQKEQAARENARAVFLARPDSERPESDEGGTRKAAYYNLFNLGERLEVPAPGQCASLRRAPGCDQAVYACGASFQSDGSGLGTRGPVVSLSLESGWAESAIKSDEEYEYGSPSEARVGRHHVIDLRPVEERDPRGVYARYELPTAFVLVREEWVEFSWCEIHNRWSCGGSQEVNSMSEACLEARGPCDAGTAEECARECREQACARAETKPSPQILKEQDEAFESLHRCSEANDHLMQTECRLVLADACSGVVGVVCESRERIPTPKSRSERRIGEVHLTRPDP